MNDACARIIVTGKVQGVGFRYFVVERAQDLRLRGFVRNRPDGTVEIEAEGDREFVEELVSRLRVGPRFARVADIHLQWQEPRHRNEAFEIR